MKKFTLLFAFILSAGFIFAQMPTQITIVPEDATAFDELTLTLDVSQTCPEGALVHADSVMIHSGVTIDGAAWSNVVDFDAMGANGQSAKLTRLGDPMPKAITISPAGATAFEEMTLTLDANISCPLGALLGADSVMIHSGVTIDGAAWSNVVSFDGMGANGQQPKLTSNGDGTWSITFTPSDFYGIDAGADVTMINCVFNIGSWDGEGKDFGADSACVDFNIPIGNLDTYKWAITYVPADFYGIDAGANVEAINCVFNGGAWDAGEGKDFDAEMNCTDFLVPFGGTGIEVNPANAFRIYPNPVEDILNIEYLNGVTKLEIYNMTGSLVKVVENITSDKVSVNTSNLNNGVYFVTVYQEGGVYTNKFVKK